MRRIIVHEVKRNFNWSRVFLMFFAFVLSVSYLVVAFVLYPEKPVDLHPGMYKITLLGGLNIAAIVVCIVSALGIVVFFSEVVSIYRYYKRQIDDLESEGKTPIA